MKPADLRHNSFVRDRGYNLDYSEITAIHKVFLTLLSVVVFMFEIVQPVLYKMIMSQFSNPSLPASSCH